MLILLTQYNQIHIMIIWYDYQTVVPMANQYKLINKSYLLQTNLSKMLLAKSKSFIYLLSFNCVICICQHTKMCQL